MGREKLKAQAVVLIRTVQQNPEMASQGP